MNALHLILLVFAFVLCAVSAFWNPPRVHLGFLGIALYILASIPLG